MEMEVDDELQKAPDDLAYEAFERLPSHYNPMKTFNLSMGDKRTYHQQYGDLYFLRLGLLKKTVIAAAKERWGEIEIHGEPLKHVGRVLDVRQGEICWIVGTIYVDMALKPNILDDIEADFDITVPPPRDKYLDNAGLDKTMLEDESGRLRMIGAPLKEQCLVTGVIVAVMGTENADGDFDVADIVVPDLPRQPQRWERDDAASAKTNGSGKSKRDADESKKTIGGKVAIVSGLEISSDEGSALSLHVLAEYLSGELSNPQEQKEVSKISRLIIAGNSLEAPWHRMKEDPLQPRIRKKPNNKYGQDGVVYNPLPTSYLDKFMARLLPSIPITLIPGASDPCNVSLPQQPLHPAMFSRSRTYSYIPGLTKPAWWDNVTNPWEGDIDGWRFMGNGGQPINDIYKYIDGDDRIGMMESVLRWRCGAPTAPDTLWCYPFHETDPFVIKDCPHVYFAGNQPRFDTKVIEGPLGQQVRLISVPKFKETGEIVLVDVDTLDVDTLTIEMFNHDDSSPRRKKEREEDLDRRLVKIEYENSAGEAEPWE